MFTQQGSPVRAQEFLHVLREFLDVFGRKEISLGKYQVSTRRGVFPATAP